MIERLAEEGWRILAEHGITKYGFRLIDLKRIVLDSMDYKQLRSIAVAMKCNIFL